MSKCIEIPNIALYEDTDSELAKYTITQLQEENQQLKDNWNKLIEVFEEEGFEIHTREYGLLDVISKDFIFDTIIELENGDSNE